MNHVDMNINGWVTIYLHLEIEYMESSVFILNPQVEV